LTVLTLLVVSTARCGAPEQEDWEQKFLARAHIATDPGSLLDFLRKRTPTDADAAAKRLEELVGQLGSDNFERREGAAKQLLAVGMLALPPLLKALTHSDPQIVQSARSCIKEIYPGAGVGLTVVRLLLRAAPAGTVTALLRYLPYALDEEVEEEIWYGLDAWSVRAGKVDPAVAAAVTDPTPARRALAGYLLARRGSQVQRTAARKLLTDPNPIVRLRAAQGLLAVGDQDAIPVLLALLAEPDVQIAWQAEELLHWIAGENAPKATVGAGAAPARHACRTAWESWWRERAGRVDLARLYDQLRRPGLCLVFDTPSDGRSPGTPRVWLCGCDGAVRWQLPDPGPSALLLPGNRILLGGGVECDLNGKVLWEYKDLPKIVPRLCVLRRLPNGNTLFASDWLQIVEVTPDGRQVYSKDTPKTSVAGADSCMAHTPLA
jgi:hypothetical protein